jgi:hypothetical protein
MNGGGMDGYRKHIAHRVNDYVPLAAFDFFPPLNPLPSEPDVVFALCESIRPYVGAALRPAPSRIFFHHHIHRFLPLARLYSAAVKRPNRVMWWKIIRQKAPLATCFNQVQNRVYQITFGMFNKMLAFIVFKNRLPRNPLSVC